MSAPRVTTESPWHAVLVIDDSGSMEGEAVRHVNEALETMIGEMAMLSGGGKKKYFKLSIIKFGSTVTPLAIAEEPADLEGRLADVASFSGKSGMTDMAAALREVAQILRANPGKQSDYQPWVFLFSDGRPDDDEAAVDAAEEVKSLQLVSGSPKIIAYGFGTANDGVMRRICSTSESYKRIESSADLLAIMPQIGTVAVTAPDARAMLQGISKTS